MSLLFRIQSRLEGRHHLRRVSLSKARPTAAAPGQAALPQLGEKVTAGAIAAAGAVALLGVGTISGPRQWLALAAAGTLVFAGLLRYLADFRREALGSLSRVVGLAAIMLLPLATVAIWDRVGEGLYAPLLAGHDDAGIELTEDHACRNPTVRNFGQLAPISARQRRVEMHRSTAVIDEDLEASAAQAVPAHDDGQSLTVEVDAGDDVVVDDARKVDLLDGERTQVELVHHD
jgi:hypothetical protein